MPTKPLERLLFAQGGNCFFCKQSLSPADASVEHLVARANGGGNAEENCVACCKALNTLLGHMSLKDKLRVILNQKGEFRCPNGVGKSPGKSAKAQGHGTVTERLALVVADLRKRGTARPRTLKSLTNTVSALFRKELSESELAALVKKLQNQGMVVVSGTKVTYELPEEGS